MEIIFSIICLITTASIQNLYANNIKDAYILQKRRQLECVDEIRVDPDLVMKTKQGQWKKNPHPLLKQWVLCALIKAGLMTAEGVYRIDEALSRVPKNDAQYVESLIDKCLSAKAIPAVDIAYNFAKCYYEAKGNHTLVSIV